MKGRVANGRTRSSLPVYAVIGLCCFFYILGAWQKSGSGKGDNIAVEITKQTNCTFFPNLIFDTHHNREDPEDKLGPGVETFDPCHDRYTDYTPCHDPVRARDFPSENMNFRERHCPLEQEKLRCLIPAPKGYLTPFSWPRSRELVPFANVPYKSLAVEEAAQNGIRYEGNVFRFPAGGSQFPQGVDAYIDRLASVIPIGNGTIRTALDTGCGVASWGAYMLERNVLTMSFAPRDLHEARVQFALERGVPAVIGVLGTIKLPYPPSSFDLAHCSRCPIPWEANDGMYMMELDRVLRPGGYWVLSGRPPINWKNNYKAWGRTEADLEAQQKKIEEIAELLCWEKISEKDDIAIWRKRINTETCPRTQHESRYRICDSSYADDVWYKKMEACLVPFPVVKSPQELYGGVLKPYPGRLNSVPSRVVSGYVTGYSAQLYQEDIRLWRKHVKAYKRINKFLDTGRYRNIIDMNAGLGSFAAAIESPKLWVMNVVPTIAEKSTLSAIYERGLIGIYHDWCEAFSTYPRTYDLIHANGVFSLYQNKCKMDDILLEMDRILRPEGAVIFRDDLDTLKKVKRMVSGMRWKTKMVEHEDGPLLAEKILFAVKKYWVSGDTYSTT